LFLSFSIYDLRIYYSLPCKTIDYTENGQAKIGIPKLKSLMDLADEADLQIVVKKSNTLYIAWWIRPRNKKTLYLYTVPLGSTVQVERSFVHKISI